MQHKFENGKIPDSCGWVFKQGYDDQPDLLCGLPASAELHQGVNWEPPRSILCDACVAAHRVYCPPEHSQQPPPRSIEQLAGELALAIRCAPVMAHEFNLKRLLIKFAEEIKRSSIEP